MPFDIESHEYRLEKIYRLEEQHLSALQKLLKAICDECAMLEKELFPKKAPHLKILKRKTSKSANEK